MRITPLVLLAVLIPGTARAVQPELVWGTYLGGKLNDEVSDIAVDPAGFVYVLGATNSADGIATPGTHKPVLEPYDTFLVKFAPDGSRVWGTYFGGDDYDFPRRVVASADRVVISGVTYSDNGIAFGATFQPTFTADNDGFVAAFTPDGAIMWGTYLGKAATDGLTLGPENEVYVVGITNGAPAIAAGAVHQPVLGGGADGYVLRLDATGNKDWGTYYGGEDNDACASVVLRPDGVLFIGGSSSSKTNIASDGAFQPALSGAMFKQDLFVAAFTSDDGVRSWSTYFGGPQAEYIASVVAYPGGGVVLSGNTQSPGLATDGTSLGGGQDTLVVRFDEDGQRVWSTYFGGSSQEDGSDIDVRGDGSIFLAGRTQSTDKVATMNALYSNLPNSYGGYVAKLAGNSGARVWGTYYGEGVAGLAYAGGRMYIGGVTGLPTNIATPGAHQPKPGGSADGFVARLDPLDLQGDSCFAQTDCQAGTCVDAVCCDTACGDGEPGDCQACSTDAGATVDGVCGPVLADTPCRPAADVCDSPETCDGDNLVCPRDALADDGTPCPAGECLAGECIPDASTTTTTTTSSASTGDSSDTGITTTTTADPTTTAEPTTGPVPTTTPTGTAGDTGDTPPSTSTASSTGTTPEDTTDSPQGTGGCGCTSAPPSGLLALLGLLLILPRRRRPK